MKNNRIFFLGLALTALMAVSCNKEQDILVEAPGRNLVVETAENLDVTKVAIAKDGSVYKMSWDGDEAAKLVERSDAAANAALYTSSAIDVTAGKAAFTFSGLTPVAGTTAYNYDILYPASAVGAATGDVIAMTMPAAQTPLVASVDPAAALLAGRNASDFDAQPASVNAPFGHLAAYVKMRVKNGSYTSGVTKVTSMTITAEGCNIAGALAYDAETGVADYTSGSASTIVLDGANLEPAYAGYDVWFACKPFTLPAGSTFTVVTETTDKGTQTATLTAGADVTFAAGKVTELPVYGISYTVTFNTNGGSTIGPIQVGRGAKVKVPPTDPTKTGALAAGAYIGSVTDPDNVDFTFGGWYSDSACTTPWDFDTQIWGNTTIYAKWDSPVESLDVSAQDVGSFNAGDPAKLVYRTIQYVNSLDLAAETHYTVVMGGNGTIWGGQFPTLNKENAVVHVLGAGSERRITTSNNANVFTLGAGTLVLGKNVLLNFNGTGAHNYPLVSIQNTSTFIMEEGSRMDDSNFKQYLIQITSSGGSFVMNGGSISNNTASTDKTPCAPIGNSWGIFVMNGGVISGNSVTSTSLAANFAGGVFVNNWANNADHHFIKNGGTISGNTATRTADGTVTGYKGNQILYLGPKKKIDGDIASDVNLTTMDDSCYAAPWQSAPVE